MIYSILFAGYKRLYTFVKTNSLNKKFTMVNTAAFSKRLEKIFDYYDLNASAFADKIDVGRATISHLLSGRNKPSLDFVMKVINTFPEVELYWLLNGKGDFPHSESSVSSKRSTSPNTTPNPAQNFEQTPKEIISEKNTLENQPKSEIERIVIFYKNGVFRTYTPE